MRWVAGILVEAFRGCKGWLRAYYGRFLPIYGSNLRGGDVLCRAWACLQIGNSSQV